MIRTIASALATLTVMLPAAAGAADGKAVWDKACAGCHAVMAPKTSDKAAWAPFVEMGVDGVTAVVMKGTKSMPPKGGARTEEEVRASVEYILEKMK
ncbi:MAG: c-type cytochrome [Steroidobacteraceae bacterium]|nr:c-type cytochrome [Steroidobacteraceae bacterium]